MQAVNQNYVDCITSILLDSRTIYVCGNGGSAAIAEHLACDCVKGVATDSKNDFALNVVSLSSNLPMISAIANDIGYDEVFSKQLQWLSWNLKDFGNYASDTLIVISSSGNSPNIIKAIEKAKERGMNTVAIVGFDGGKAKELANWTIHIPSDNYGIIEDASQAIMHFMAQEMRRFVSNKNPEDIKY
ncbi:MAG: SIS domain-containing protein [Cytophagales bacterium]|nr:SIS domain-containing protein [Cytophagales bacterium]